MAADIAIIIAMYSSNAIALHSRAALLYVVAFLYLCIWLYCWAYTNIKKKYG